MFYPYIIMLILSLSYISVSEINVPEQKIARTVEKVLKITEFELERQDELSLSCIGPRQYTQQINIIHQSEYLGNVFVRRVHTCDPNACDDPTVIASKNPEDLEYFDYFIIIDKDSIVQDIMVYDYQATHGHEIAKRSWVAQFINKQNEPLVYEQNIDGISGATISAQNFTDEIDFLIACYKGK